MLKYCLCQSFLFYGGNTSKALAQYKVALVSEIIIALQCRSNYFAGMARKLSALAFCFKCDSD